MYGRPMYAINLTGHGKPDEFMRLGFITGENQPEFEGDMSDDDFFYLNNASTQFQRLMTNYTFVLKYSGLRWYGSLLPPGKLYYTESLFATDYHAFWDEAFSGVGEPDNSTFLISAPNTDDLTPVGVDFYEMRRRNIPSSGFSYGSMGIVLPLIKYKGGGFYHCIEKEKVGTYVGPPESAMEVERANNTATTAPANMQQTGAQMSIATTNGVDVLQEDNTAAAYVPLSLGTGTANATDSATNQTGELFGAATTDVAEQTEVSTGNQTNQIMDNELVVAPTAEVQQTGGADAWW
jgi:hypothetical protein